MENNPSKSGIKRLLDILDDAIAQQKSAEPMPETWAAVRQALRDLQKVEPPVRAIDTAHYLEMAKELVDPINVLENWLTKTGVVFYQKGLFQDKIILDQAWAIQAVYVLFDRKKYHYSTFLHKKGRFSGKDLVKIWADNAHAERELFLSFMLSCELCFETTPKREKEYWHAPFEERTFIAPQLLALEKPDTVKMVLEHWDGKQLHFRYQHRFLHKGILRSFIVRTHAHADLKDIWRNGILLQIDRVYAVIEAEDNAIHVQVPREGKSLLDKVRNLLEQLQDQQGEELVSTDGSRFVRLEKLKGQPPQNSLIQTENGDWVMVAELAAFLNKDDNDWFKEEKYSETSPIPVVFAAFANPERDLQNLSEEQEGIQTALRPLQASGKINYTDCYSMNLDDFFDYLKDWENQIELFHYAGHSNGKELSLQNRHAYFEPLADELVKRNVHSLKIVVLNGCSTKTHVKDLLEKGVKAVIATAAGIDDDLAKVFAVRFYKNLAQNDTLERAYRSAANYIKSGRNENWLRYFGEIRRAADFEEGDYNSSEFPWGLYIGTDESILSYTL